MRRRQRSRVRDKDSNADLLRTAIFSAPLKTSLALTKGTGGPTWSRATAAWRFNDLGYLRQIPSGCAEFGGARLVVNLAPRSEVINAGWTLSGVTASDANTLLESAGGTTHQCATPITTLGTYLLEVWLKRGAGSTRHVRLEVSSSDLARVNFNLDTGEVASIAQTGAIALINYGADASVDAGGYRRFYIRVNVSASASNSFYPVRLTEGLNGSISYSGDGTSSILISKVKISDVTGRDASYVPEYVSVGSTVGKNFFLHTDDFSQSAWNKTNITVTQTAIANPVNGRVDAQKVEAASSASTSMYQSCTSAGLAAGNVFVVYAKAGSGSTDANRFVLRNSTTSTNLLWVTLNYSTGEITYVTGSDGASAVALSDGWWKITLVATSGVSDGNTLVGYVGFGGPSETAGEFLYAYRPYLGQGTTAPDVIPVVAGSWDPHGSGADGVKYFSTDYTKNRALTSLNGLRKESSATNALLWSRDLSNAAWSTKTNITAAKTATGLDGIANSASTLTATSADAIILQPITLASAARCASTYVKRVTGTGTISFTQDGGSTWTDITSLINTSTYYRVQITATLANPSVGFKISTSGDAIEVDCVQNEAGSVATSPIVTTTATVTRNADVLTYQTSGNIDATVGSCYVMYSAYEEVVASARAIVGLSTTAATANALLYNALSVATTSLYSGDGTTSISKSGLLSAVNTPRKRAISWGGSTRLMTGDGVSSTSGAFSGTLPSTAIGIGGYTNGTLSMSGRIGDVAIYNYKMTDAELQAVTK